jgi:hypothetical protein
MNGLRISSRALLAYLEAARSHCGRAETAKDSRLEMAAVVCFLEVADISNRRDVDSKCVRGVRNEAVRSDDWQVIRTSLINAGANGPATLRG